MAAGATSRARSDADSWSARPAIGIQAAGGVVAVRAQHQPGDIHAGFQPAGPAAGVVIEPGVLNGHPGGGGQGDGQGLVFGGEVVPAFFFREVEVPEHHLPDPDRDTQEGLHGRVVCGEPVRFRVLAQIMQPKRPGVRNQEAEHAVAGRQRTDLPRQFAVDADSDEVAQRVVITDDSQGTKACMQQPAGRFDHAFQDGIQAQVLGQGDDRFQQARHAFLGLE